MAMRTLTVLGLLLCITACAETGSQQAPAAADSYEDRLADVQQLMDEARSLGHGWSTFEPLLESAAEAKAAGDDAEAMRLLDEAKAHAALAITQAEFEAEAWRDRVVK